VQGVGLSVLSEDLHMQQFAHYDAAQNAAAAAAAGANNEYGAVAVDGTFVYVHTARGLLKLGSGRNGTIEGASATRLPCPSEPTHARAQANC
jgi:hypothetical protein